MERNKILFSGQSNTFGLGLELEFRPRYNNHEWLLENGINLPDLTNTRASKDQKIWKKYRWTGLVCKELGYEELNIHDDWAEQYGGLEEPELWDKYQNTNSYRGFMPTYKKYYNVSWKSRKYVNWGYRLSNY